MSGSPDLSWPQQSPIDIDRTYYSPDLVAPDFRYPRSIIGKFDHASHNFIVSTNSTAHIVFEGIDCKLVKLHFHHPSEHKIHGVAAPFELHLVHKISVFPEGFPSAYVVVGVMFDRPGKKGRAIESKPGKKFLREKDAFQQKHQTFDEGLVKILFALGVKPKGENEYVFDSDNLLPKDGHLRDHYRYEGSLTTATPKDSVSPYYPEYVSWVVLRERAILDTPEEAEILAHTNHPPRPCQPLNRRFVLRNFDYRKQKDQKEKE